MTVWYSSLRSKKKLVSEENEIMTLEINKFGIDCQEIVMPVDTNEMVAKFCKYIFNSK